jgi:hypothetical protein
MTVLWDAALCSPVEIYPDDGDSKHLWNAVNFYQTTRRNNPEDGRLHICRQFKKRRQQGDLLQHVQFMETNSRPRISPRRVNFQSSFAGAGDTSRWNKHSGITDSDGRVQAPQQRGDPDNPVFDSRKVSQHHQDLYAERALRAGTPLVRYRVVNQARLSPALWVFPYIHFFLQSVFKNVKLWDKTSKHLTK